jgi:hypothetical protein
MLLGVPLEIRQFVALATFRYACLATVLVSTPALNKLAIHLDTPAYEHSSAQQLLKQALAEQGTVVDAARQSLPLQSAYTLFLKSRTGLARLWALLVHVVMMAVLTITGLARISGDSVSLSHPELTPDIPLVGRPGVRLVYASHFGLHYQIWPASTTLTWMPGMAWPYTNEETTAELIKALEELSAL